MSRASNADWCSCRRRVNPRSVSFSNCSTSCSLPTISKDITLPKFMNWWIWFETYKSFKYASNSHVFHNLFHWRRIAVLQMIYTWLLIALCIHSSFALFFGFYRAIIDPISLNGFLAIRVRIRTVSTKVSGGDLTRLMALKMRRRKRRKKNMKNCCFL